MKKFIFYWLDGRVDSGSGTDVYNAFIDLGHRDEDISKLKWYRGEK
jgi:hypothetical protein